MRYEVWVVADGIEPLIPHTYLKHCRRCLFNFSFVLLRFVLLNVRKLNPFYWKVMHYAQLIINSFQLSYSMFIDFQKKYSKNLQITHVSPFSIWLFWLQESRCGKIKKKTQTSNFFWVGMQLWDDGWDLHSITNWMRPFNWILNNELCATVLFNP